MTAKRVNRVINLIYIGFSSNIMARSIILPALKAEFSLNYVQTSIVVVLSTVGYLLMNVLSYFISRKIGLFRSLRLFIGGLAGLSAALFLCHSYQIAVCIFFLSGCCYGGLDCNIVASVKHIYPEDDGRKLNSTMAFYSVGSIASAIFTGYTLEISGNWRIPFLIISGICLAGWISTFSLTADVPASEKEKQATGKKRSLNIGFLFLFFLTFTALYAGVENVVNNWLMTFVNDLLPEAGYFQSAVVISVYYIADLIGRPISGAMMSRFETISVAFTACLAAAVTVFLIAFSSGVALVMVLIAVFGMVRAGVYPVLMSLTSKAGKSEAVYSITYVCVSVSNLVLNYLTGVVADISGMTGAFRITAVLLLVVAFAIAVGRKVFSRGKGL